MGLNQLIFQALRQKRFFSTFFERLGEWGVHRAIGLFKVKIIEISFNFS